MSDEANEPLIGIALYLDEQGIVEFDPIGTGGNAFIEKLPQTPDVAVGIFAMGGFQSSGTHGYDSPSVNIQVRGAPADSVGALALARKVYGALHGLHHTRLPDGTLVIGCLGMQSGPIRLGQDENDRFRFSLNFNMEIRNVTEHRE